jgi:hypothetical protein
MTFAQRHPIILPNSSVIALIIEHEHKIHLHSGTQATLYAVLAHRRPKSSLAYGKGLRLLLLRQSTAVGLRDGVDYCGLFYIKDRKDRNRRKVKIYVAIFVCLSVKAVHIELVDDLTSEAFTPHFEDSSRGEGFTRPSIPTTARTSLGPTTNCGNFAFSYSRALTRRRYRHFYPIGKLNGASYPLTPHTSAGYERPR